MHWFLSVASHVLGFILCCSPWWEVNTRTAILLPLPNFPLFCPAAREPCTCLRLSTVPWFPQAPHLSRDTCTSCRSQSSVSIVTAQVLSQHSSALLPETSPASRGTVPLASAVCDRVPQPRSEGGVAPENLPFIIIFGGDLSDDFSFAICHFIS